MAGIGLSAFSLFFIESKSFFVLPTAIGQGIWGFHFP
jgi:hypothetical protein